MRNLILVIVALVIVMIGFLCTTAIAKPSKTKTNDKMEVKATYADLLHAIHMVESGGRKANVPKGDNGKARGPFQIHRAYWIDATNHDANIGGKYEDCDDYDYALKVVMAYMDRYASKAVANGDWEVVARTHNGGLAGWKNPATLKYWQKVQKYL